MTLTQPPKAEIAALTRAADILREHSIDISLPWDGDLDDLEQDRYEGLLLACRAYAVSIRLSPLVFSDMP